ncbi:MAG: DegT/DnrJ/EryC1/StrS family aminotransferase [Rhodobacteraceae bacterium]|jgi:dTDP-3-amino-3,4,6-trideoxy-alpha-D-glucose transaminase|nr:DegT/DnrJ/EryC1/StrS family aminotransferase [Paracoccaceae bacterium]
MKYPFLDVGFTYKSLQAQMDAALHDVMDSGLYIGGPAVARFEAAFADYCGARHCVGVGNGLDALVLALRALEIGPGDEVIVPANTFIATWIAVAQAGATPVPVDADPETMNIDLGAIPGAITERTRAIMPVHLYGAPVPDLPLRALAEEHGLRIIEDAAQAHGARVDNRRAGMLGHVAGFSFYPGKNLGAFGDGGAIVTDDAELAERIRMLGSYGSREKYNHESIGYNSRLDPLQAAMLAVKLGVLEEWNARRREIAATYLDLLAGTPGLRLPATAPGTESVWHLFVVRHPHREALRAALAARGVGTVMHYPIPNHRSGAFSQSHGHLSFPVTDEICETCLSLPIGPHMSIADAREIAALVDDAARNL